ncbi:hypothetical protein I4U23_000018 [Adineta vaga]|nr:hypothetical protein I4U23_000018 [Adineta vaga]
MLQSNSNLSSNERKRLLNIQLSILPAFTPLNGWRVYCINQTTDPSLLHYLIELARKTVKYTIDTEHDYYTHEAALIQIEFIRRQSVILLIETCHLPQASTVTFWLIKSLFKIIFNPSNAIYSWGDAVNELSRFTHYNLFSCSSLYQMNNIDIQSGFKICTNQIRQKICNELIRYAANDCLAVTKLQMLVGFNYTKEQLDITRATYQDGSDDKQQQQIERQSDPLSITDTTKTFIENDQQKFVNNQQVEGISTDVNLIDFLRCYIPLERCKVENYVINHSDTQSTTFRKDAPLTQEEEDGKETTKELKQISQSNQFATSRTESNEDK